MSTNEEYLRELEYQIAATKLNMRGKDTLDVLKAEVRRLEMREAKEVERAEQRVVSH